MRRDRVLASLLTAAAIGSHGPSARAGDPEPLRIEASVVAPDSRTFTTRVVIEPSGVATVVRSRVRSRVERGSAEIALSFDLTSAEHDDLRRAVLTSRFFEAQGRREPIVLHDPQWDVSIRLGSRELRRHGGEADLELGALARELRRFVGQADLVAELREGEFGRTSMRLVYGYGTQILRPDALAPDIVACIAQTMDFHRCGVAAGLLVRLPSVEAWTESARDVLATIRDERRGIVLGSWVVELRASDRAEHHAAFRPMALEEIDASWSRWPSMTERERVGYGVLLDSLLQDRHPRAFEIAEEMARVMGSIERPFVPPGLLETGADAVPVTVRLLGTGSAGARASGARIAQAFATVLRGKSAISRSLSADERQALERRFREEIVPAVEACLQDATQPLAIRRTCAEALDAWDGRVRAAEVSDRVAAEATRGADDERRRGMTPPPAIQGPLSISGRLSISPGVRLPGFAVFAVRDDGGVARGATTDANGSFVIEGLADGVYTLFDTRPGERFGGVRGGGAPAATNVVAGTRDLDLRLPGTLIRGRLLDSTGRPAKDHRLMARMRDEPMVQGPEVGSDATTTDAEGRFWFVRLMSGTYDIEILGEPLLRGATGIAVGPEELTVAILTGGTITGRVVDETGAPLDRAYVVAAHPGRVWDPVQRADTRPDGTFRLEPLDPSKQYTVAASFTFLGGDGRGVVVEDVSTGTSDVTLRIDTAPRIRFRLDRGGRAIAGWGGLRLTRVEGGTSTERTFNGEALDWRMAIEGTWKVSVLASDLDARGAKTFSWVDVGTVRPGDPERTFRLPP